MEELIKEIRLQVGLNRQEFVQSLEVSPETIVHWENAEKEPNKQEQKKIYKFCYLKVSENV